MLHFPFNLPTPIKPEGDLNDARHQLPQAEIDRMRRGASYTHNNPGHLVFQNQENAIKGDVSPDGKNYWARFKSPDAGIRAMISDVIDIKFSGKSKHITPDQTIGDFISVYTTTDRNSYQKLIKERTGLSPEVKLKDIPKNLYNRFIKAMIRKENVQFYKENLGMINTILPDEESKMLTDSSVKANIPLSQFLKQKNGQSF